MTKQTKKAVSQKQRCECGCGKATSRVIRLLREQDRGTAETLGWAELSVAPMLVAVSCCRGHEDGLNDFCTDKQ